MGMGGGGGGGGERERLGEGTKNESTIFECLAINLSNSLRRYYRSGSIFLAY